MRNVYFRKAGIRDDEAIAMFYPIDKVRKSDGIYHKNRYTTQWAIPVAYFKRLWSFDRVTNCYRTKQTFGNIVCFRTVFDHDFGSEMSY